MNANVFNTVFVLLCNSRHTGEFGMPSLSLSGSQASPKPSESVSSWPLLGTVGQLSYNVRMRLEEESLMTGKLFLFLLTFNNRNCQ